MVRQSKVWRLGECNDYKNGLWTQSNLKRSGSTIQKLVVLGQLLKISVSPCFLIYKMGIKTMYS